MTSVALALLAEGATFHRYAGPDAKLEQKVESNVERLELLKETHYRMRLPLESLGIEARAGVLLRLNVVVLDDDDGKGYNYWRQMTPGLAGGVDVNAYKLFVLGE